ncbi:methionine--tRNA ligase [Tengunoibacter tsumagoiensis]|uniref:Methionine--tRNA ligase n=1 Tax=Tengunoibacter tsumagoiensis TaxID=2014871 RepID=A0A402A3Y8_9CHLR|nr:methionine--tRNA ligase [Tengunoibacter tsumagoiensis]GCE13766.1 methionine--tRNA ligase [Tengunoibacter tsumagoiensis]
MVDAVEQTTYYLTTAIDYPNGVPHIGHALEKVAADIVARYHRLLGDDTYFSMGLDENSQHVLRAAYDRHIEPQAWIDQIDQAFRTTWARLDISYDDWIRTTEERHRQASLEMFQRAKQQGDIYKAVYSGWYCPNCNNYYNSEDLVSGRCPIHTSLTPEWLHEENYFFALSKYSVQLQEHIESHPEFVVPASRRAEVLGLLKQGLRDFSVSRQVRPGTISWGIPVPDDPSQVIYVWFDALVNYLTAVGFPHDEARLKQYWPADAHVIGKDITRFHCLYWPAMLLSANLPLPRQIPVHGFTTIEGQKLSKTLGNVIDPVAVVDKVGADALRFYLARNLSFGNDSDFSRTGLLRHYNDELGNDLGNLLNRVVSMVQRYCGGEIPAAGPLGAAERELKNAALEARLKAEQALESWEINIALNAIWTFVRRTNQYIEHSAPWKLAKQPEQHEYLRTVLASAAEATRIQAILLAPFIPSSAQRIYQQLGLGRIDHGDWHAATPWGSQPLTHVVPGALLFPRLDAEIVATL